jgi:hypothetical protein
VDTLTGPGPDRRREHRFAGLALDPRVGPLAALLGSIAIALSVLSEWQVTTFEQDLFGGEGVGGQPLASSVGALGAWGAGYLMGAFGLVTSVALLLFGPRPGRAYARIVALCTGGLLLVLLAALAREIDGVSFVLHPMLIASISPDQYTLVRGRGLYCACVGVVLVLAVAALTRRRGDERPSQAVEPPRTPEWAWQRADDDEPDAEAPLDLTVGPAAPFREYGDDRDRPDRRIG